MSAALAMPHSTRAFADAQAPRYTSYPTAVQFGPSVDADSYARWLAAVPGETPVSVYVHVPFCRRLCWYCGCNMRVVRRSETITDYVRLLDREIELVFWAGGRVLPVSHLHLGGGSPDSLSADDLDRLFASLRYAFYLPKDLEFDAELDPAHVSAAWVHAAARHGLTRASLGVQTFAPHVQAAIHRPQPFKRVAEVVGELRGAGVKAINFDLMYGLPLQTTADIRASLDQALTLRPNRLAVFGYAHVPNMKRHQRLINGADLPGASARMEQAAVAAERLVAEGYVRIGLDHFALPDDEMAVALANGRLRRNFQGYTTDPADTLIGLGASAIGKLPGGYVQNHTELADWRAALAKGRLATARGVALRADDTLRADVIERLMCRGHVDLQGLCAAHGQPLSVFDDAWGALNDFREAGLIRIDGWTIRLTEAGAPLVRVVCTAFDRYFRADAGRYSKAV